MSPAVAGLVDRKEDLRKWIWEDKLTVLQVIEKLDTEFNVVCRKRTLERNLRNWGISKRSKPDQAAIHEELTRLFHGPHLTDRAIADIMNEAGHVINKRTVMETRKKLGLHKRLRPEADESELQKTIKDVLTTEYQDERVLKMQRGELYAYLRQKYPDLNLVGRDRVYNIAREMNPHAIRRYQKGHPLYQNRPYKLSGKRLAAKLAKDADAAAADTNPPTDHDQDSAAPAEEPHYDPPMAHDYHSPQTSHVPPPHDAIPEAPVAPQSYQPLPVYPSVASNPQLLHPSLRVQDLEKENDALHQRLQQQEAEIRYMRQAYHDMMQRLGSVPASNSYSQ
jgi:transposase